MQLWLCESSSKGTLWKLSYYKMFKRVILSFKSNTDEGWWCYPPWVTTVNNYSPCGSSTVRLDSGWLADAHYAVVKLEIEPTRRTEKRLHTDLNPAFISWGDVWLRGVRLLKPTLQSVDSTSPASSCLQISDRCVATANTAEELVNGVGAQWSLNVSAIDRCMCNFIR